MLMVMMMMTLWMWIWMMVMAMMMMMMRGSVTARGSMRDKHFGPETSWDWTRLGVGSGEAMQQAAI